MGGFFRFPAVGTRPCVQRRGHPRVSLQAASCGRLEESLGLSFSKTCVAGRQDEVRKGQANPFVPAGACGTTLYFPNSVIFISWSGSALPENFNGPDDFDFSSQGYALVKHSETPYL